MLIRLLLYGLVFYLTFRLIIKPLLRMLLLEAVEKEFGKFRPRREENRKPEGSIHVDYIPEKDKNRNKSRKNDNEGEYVDYEEVK